MRRVNSVGGFRIRPSSPDDAEFVNQGLAYLGQFNDGMDRLNRESELSSADQDVLQNLPEHSPLKMLHQVLTTQTDLIRFRANEHQDFLAGRAANHQGTSTNELGRQLIRLSQDWQRFKQELQQHHHANDDED